MVIQAEGESGGREEKKAWGGIIVSEKPHLMAALCLGRGPEGQRTGLEVGLGLPLPRRTQGQLIITPASPMALRVLNSPF